ncbi:hypothetical protein DPMN_046396 [Dreissena polymorpha]|uniref:Uncharacterized protein n=1 Tax=Dreissena polymorpha TaxID=45954 RepID=A0A9D4D5U2_DREPO|nr:hypothetical protein DPMN_046396 [Dreissena polymorpha]
MILSVCHATVYSVTFAHTTFKTSPTVCRVSFAYATFSMSRYGLQCQFCPYYFQNVPRRSAESLLPIRYFQYVTLRSAKSLLPILLSIRQTTVCRKQGSNSAITADDTISDRKLRNSNNYFVVVPTP